MELSSKRNSLQIGRGDWGRSTMVPAEESTKQVNQSPHITVIRDWRQTGRRSTWQENCSAVANTEILLRTMKLPGSWKSDGESAQKMETLVLQKINGVDCPIFKTPNEKSKELGRMKISVNIFSVVTISIGCVGNSTPST